MGVVAVHTLDMVAGAARNECGFSGIMRAGGDGDGVDGKLAKLRLDIFCSDIAVVAGVTIGFFDVGIKEPGFATGRMGVMAIFAGVCRDRCEVAIGGMRPGC